MELLNSVSGSRYPPLSDVVRDVDTNSVVKAEKRLVRAYAHTGAMVVVIRELRYQKEARPGSLIFRRVGLEVVLDYSV